MGPMVLVGSRLHMGALDISELLLGRILIVLGWLWCLLNYVLSTVLRRVGSGKGAGGSMAIAEITLLGESRIDLALYQRMVHVALVTVEPGLARASVEVWVEVLESGIEGSLAILLILLFYSYAVVTAVKGRLCRGEGLGEIARVIMML